MGRGGAGLIAAVLVLAGCKSTDPKPTDKDPAGTTASRTKGADGKGPAWLDPVDKVPGSDFGDSKNFGTQDGVVGGRVLDSANHPVGNVYIQVEAVNPPPGSRAAVGIYSDQSGVFSTQGLKSGKAYNLTAEATLNGKQYTASVQTLVPNPNIALVLRDDLGLPPVGILKGPAAGTFPPHPTLNDPGSDRIPPMGFNPPAPRPTDGAWAPGAEATRSVPTTIAPSTPKPTQIPSGAIPPPDDLTLPAKPPLRPENVADGPKSPWAPPPAIIPGPALPPSFPNPVPPPAPPDPIKMGMSGTGAGFILLDTLERNWEFPANKSGSVVLVEFMTTTCEWSKGVIPVIADLQSRYGNAGLQVIAVACDELPQKQRIATSAKYAQDNNLNYPIYVEPGTEAGAVRNRYNVKGYPTVVLLDATGAVLWQGHPNKRADLETAIKRALGK
jgi:thiol-disulfide isomerase/thioredoxin